MTGWDPDEMQLLHQLSRQCAPLTVMSEQLGRPGPVVMAMLDDLLAGAAPVQPRAEHSPWEDREPPVRRGGDAQHIRRVWEVSQGRMFPFGVSARRA